MPKPLPRVSKRGFELLGDKAQVLLLHGYTGSPYDLRLLGDFLNQQGLHVIAPLLKGHGTKAQDLNNVSLNHWLKQTKKALNSLDQSGPIIVGGLSMGALLAIVLAANESKIDAILLFSPSLRLHLTGELAIASAQLGLLNKNTILKKHSGSDISDPIAKKRTPAYKEMPVAGLLQFAKLRTLAKEKLGLVSCPIFMAFGKQDAAVNVMAAHQLILENALAPIFSKFYDNSKHVITLDYDKEELFTDVWHFLNNQLGL